MILEKGKYYKVHLKNGVIDHQTQESTTVARFDGVGWWVVNFETFFQNGSVEPICEMVEKEEDFKHE